MCEKDKPLSGFYTRKGKPRSICKSCENSRRNSAWADLDADGRKEAYRKEKLAKAGRDKAFDRQRWKASKAARRALKRGDIVMPPKCEKCHRKPPVDLHHSNYSRPLDVHFYCRSCHGKIHRSKQKIMLFGKDVAA